MQLFVLLAILCAASNAQLCGDADRAAAATCDSDYTACNKDAFENRDKYPNTCHCYVGYARCSTSIPCIQASAQYKAIIDVCTKHCAPCDTNATTSAVAAVSSTTENLLQSGSASAANTTSAVVSGSGTDTNTAGADTPDAAVQLHATGAAIATLLFSLALW